MATVCGLSRCLSFEEEPQLHLQSSPRVPTAPAGQPALGGDAAAAPPNGERQQLLEHLQSYLRSLGTLEQAAGNSGLAPAVQLPSNFGALVQQVASAQRNERNVARGWLAAAEDKVQDGSTPPLTPAAAAESSAQDPQLREALLKLQQLEGTLQAASQRAAEVAAASKALVQYEQAAGSSWGSEEEDAALDGGSTEAEPSGATASGALALAMRRTRQRLQHEERLRAALREGGSVDADASSAVAEESASSCSGGGAWRLTAEQEQLVEVLMGQPEADGTDSLAAPLNPFTQHLALVAGIEEQLAALGSNGTELAACGAGSSSPATPPSMGRVCAVCSKSQEEDLEAVRFSYLRAQQEERNTARRVSEIDAALRALRMGSSSVAAV